MRLPKEIEDDLAKSGLAWEDVGARDWRIIDTAETGAFEDLKHILGFTSYGGHSIFKACNHILAIPYPHSNFIRVKLYPPLDGTKYLQPKDIPPAPYILPEVGEIKEKPHRPLIITEGEKKTLCLIKHGFNAIGLPGVWCFKNTKQNLPLLKELEEWVWQGRTVHICFDSDAIYNQNVRKAEIELAIRLIAKGAIVKIIRLPQFGHANKVGADDLIASQGVEEFQKVYDRALPLEKAYSKEYFEDILSTIVRIGLPKFRQSILVEAFSKAWKINKKLLLSYIESKESAETERVIFTQKEKEEALKLLNDPCMWDKLIETTEFLGYVGEEVNKKTLYLAAISSKTDQGISCYIKGQSGAGKNSLGKCIAELIPADMYIKLSDLSPKSLYHLDRDLSHKVLFIEEIEGTEQSSYSLRLAQSEGELIYSYPIKNPATGEFKTIEKKVPARGMSLWVTTTKLRIHEENETRGFDLFVDEGKEQTRRILEAEARDEVLREVEKEKREEVKRIWQCAFTLLKPHPVYIPYAEYLAKVFSADKVRIRRDFPRFLALIKANCLLHQYQREEIQIQGKTFLMANLDDYAVAYEIGLVVLRQTLQELSSREEELLEKIREKFGTSEFQPKDTEGLASVGYEQIRKYLQNLVKKGYLEWNGKRGNQSKYIFVKPASEGVKIPRPEEIKKIVYMKDTLLPKLGKMQSISTKSLGNAQITQTLPKPSLSVSNENDKGGLGNHKVISALPYENAQQNYKRGGLGSEVMDIKQRYIVINSFMINGRWYTEGEEVDLPLSIAEELLKTKHIRSSKNEIII